MFFYFKRSAQEHSPLLPFAAIDPFNKTIKNKLTNVKYNVILSTYSEENERSGYGAIRVEAPDRPQNGRNEPGGPIGQDRRGRNQAGHQQVRERPDDALARSLRASE